MVTNVIIRSLNNYNSAPSYGSYANSNNDAMTEQKLVNGDLLTAGVFEPVLPTNSLKSSGNGVGGATYSENAFANNVVNAINKSNCATVGVNNFVKTDIKVEPKSFENQKESSSAVKVKCEVESTSGYSNNSGVTNHVDEKQRDTKLKDIKQEKERPLTAKEQEDIKRHNLNVRMQIFKELRRKGHSEYIFYSIFKIH